MLAVDLGRTAYQETLELQRRLVEARRRGETGDLLLFCTHEEVVTRGRKAQIPGRDSNEVAGVSAAGIPVVEVERGGADTYHGPGQLVGYPIVQLKEGERDLHRFLRSLEGSVMESIAGSLEDQDLEPSRREGLTGVWVGERKVASIGIACRQWVTYHGFALNLTTDLSRFTLFRPCDLESQVMASLETLGAVLTREEAMDRIHTALARLLGRRPERGELTDV